MRHVMRGATPALIMAMMMAAPMAMAKDSALIVGNTRYQNLDRVNDARAITRVRNEFLEAGFAVVAGADIDARETPQAIGEFLKALDQHADRAVVLLAGHFVNNGQETYLLNVQVDGQVTMLEAHQNGLPISLILAILADYPGQAVLVLGQSDLEDRTGTRMHAGIGLLDIPQGVTVFRGPADAAARFAQRGLLQPNVSVTDSARRYGMQIEGYAPRNLSLMGSVRDVAEPRPVRPRISEPAMWDQASSEDTLESYQAYLNTYPEGDHARDARAMIEEIRNDPFRTDRKREEALRLNRDDRRTIQRNLTLLGYNTRGVDGIFGRGSRGAIRNWQRANGQRETSFLTGNQVIQLQDQADRRQAELEEEARQKREAEERRDRAYWRDTGAFGDEAGLVAYLERYPDGLFASEAQATLDAILEQRRRKAERRDRRQWEEASAADTVEAYRTYLRDRPDGAFASQAKARLKELSRSPEERQAEERAIERENGLRLNQATRKAIEERLAAFGADPGARDGVFDEDTRRALRRFQKSRGLPATGYVDQATIVFILAGSFGRN